MQTLHVFFTFAFNSHLFENPKLYNWYKILFKSKGFHVVAAACEIKLIYDQEPCPLQRKTASGFASFLTKQIINFDLLQDWEIKYSNPILLKLLFLRKVNVYSDVDFDATVTFHCKPKVN